MDFKVYTKEEVSQPNGTEYIITPNVIDLYPEIITDENGKEKLKNAIILTEDKDLIEQAVALSTIWQKGQDPLDVETGIRWSETMLGEITVLQLMDDIKKSVEEVTPSIDVVFDTVTDDKGNQFLKYTLQAKA